MTTYTPATQRQPLDQARRTLVRELEDRYSAAISRAQTLRSYEFNPYSTLLSAAAYAQVIGELVPVDERGVWSQREQDTRYEALKLHEHREDWDDSWIDSGYDYIWDIYSPARGGWGCSYLYPDEALEARRKLIQQYGPNNVPVPSPEDRLKEHRAAEKLRDQQRTAGTYDRERAHRRLSDFLT